MPTPHIDEIIEKKQADFDDQFGTDVFHDLDGSNPLPFSLFRNYASIRRVIGYWMRDAYEAGRQEQKIRDFETGR